MTHACQVSGVSRKTHYQRMIAASECGTSALMPKYRRATDQPNAISLEEVAP